MKSYSFKSLYLAFVLVAPAFLFTSCEDEALRGHGDVVSRSRPVGTFDKINAGGEFDIYLSQGPAEDIALEGQENVLTELSTQVRGNTLYIKYDRNRVRVNKIPKIYITTPQLSGLKVSGANSVRGLTDWQVNELDIDASGSGNINLNVKDASTIDSHISGSADIYLAGNADNHEIDISGSGTIKAFELSTKTTEVKVSGSGRSEVTVSEHLKANITGSGKVRYKGSPVVDTKITGSGSVSQVN
jgi:hypothetical protein